MAEDDHERAEFLPATAYAVLGLLSSHQEELSPAEIKVRADWSLRSFYWSPAVSHIRRELERLLECGYVEARLRMSTSAGPRAAI
ncbi:hypothetical protein [Microbacterium sp. No. 7]|uniref:hypothetical protein n=1 Tax=Microbacterium sp. No. 7 TaxID=1714373 RepID=UPI0006D1662F|nr:hypothetical protein [Microbacterium sp. No. 7]ALJ22343.1 hypothetical protein AOA12_22120 [Microbacterium sp. No. 7]